jgi:transposase-like protein
MSRKYRKFTRAFKIQVAQARLNGMSIAELIRKYDIHANLIYKWTVEYRMNPTGAFRLAPAEEETADGQPTRAELEQMIGRLTMENDFLKKALQHAEDTLHAMPPVKDGAA